MRKPLLQGANVITPRVRGVVVHHFPASKKRHFASYTVRIPNHPYAVVFYAREVRPA